MKEFSIFQQIVNDLQKLDRIKKRDTQILILRAQSTNDQFKNKKNKNVSKITCVNCENNYFDSCFVTHFELRKEYEINKKKQQKTKKKKKKKKKKIKKKKIKI